MHCLHPEVRTRLAFALEARRLATSPMTDVLYSRKRPRRQCSLLDMAHVSIDREAVHRRAARLCR
jgi:hypothetical protein